MTDSYEYQGMTYEYGRGFTSGVNRYGDFSEQFAEFSAGRSQPRDLGGRFASRGMVNEVGVFAFAAELEGIIAGSEFIQAAKEAKAREVRDFWVSIAPVRGDKPPGGHIADETAYGTNWPEDYRNSIEVHKDKDGFVFVGSDLLPLAEWLEYGSRHNPEHGYGARVLAAFNGTGEAAQPSRVARRSASLFTA